MGAAHGKLTLHPVQEPSKADTPDETIHKTVEAVETASQPTSGKPGEPQTELIESVDAGPNGTVNVTETSELHETEKKKLKNPFGWIKRRLSKKNSITKEASQEETQPEEADAAVEQSQSPVPEEQVNETAESLVNEVISSAVAVQNEQGTPVQQTDLSVTEEPQASEREISHSVVEEIHSDTAVLPNVESTEVTTDNEVHEIVQNEHPQEEVNSVLDTNNTNVSIGDTTTPAPTPVEDEVQEAVFSKLVELELTNGHSEQHPTENGFEAEHDEVIVNGE